MPFSRDWSPAWDVALTLQNGTQGLCDHFDKTSNRDLTQTTFFFFFFLPGLGVSKVSELHGLFCNMCLSEG